MVASEKKDTAVKAMVLIALIAFTFLGVTNLILDNTVGKLVVDPARAYVAEARSEAMNAFLLLSAVKAIVAVVEGSDVGGLQLGDIVQSLYDAIDICWKMMFISLSTLVVLEFMLSLSSLLCKWLFGITLITWLLFTLTRKELPRRLLLFFASIALLFYLAVPVSLVLASVVSRQITEPVRNEFEKELDDLKATYEAEIDRIKSEKLIDVDFAQTPVTVFHQTVNIPTSVRLSYPLIVSISRLADELKDVYEKLVELLFRSGIAWLFDVLLVPVGLLFVFYKIGLMFLEKLVSRDSSAQLKKAVEQAVKGMGIRKAE